VKRPGGGQRARGPAGGRGELLAEPCERIVLPSARRQADAPEIDQPAR
jgi:hypothetical protein